MAKIFRLLFCFVFASAACAQPEAVFSQKTNEALEYCRQHDMNSDFCFLMDLSQHSGKNRFFVYSFKTKTVIAQGLVCHGTGKNSTPEKPVFSNEVGSNCSSTGKFSVGKRAYSQWGIHVHYKLHGLERSNSNAFKRTVVLHSYTPVPGGEIYPSHLPMGWSLGCPVIADDLMRKIDTLLQKTTKPTLLWIYNE